VVTGSFILDYSILVFLASCGVFQMIAACEGFRGMLFFKYRPGSFLLGLGLLIGAFTWFFLSGSRNVPDSAHGMNGNEQFAYFFAGSGAGLAFTLVVASLRNRSLGAERADLPPGLGVLRECNYLRALYRTCRSLWPRKHRGAEATPTPTPQSLRASTAKPLGNPVLDAESSPGLPP